MALTTFLVLFPLIQHLIYVLQSSQWWTSTKYGTNFLIYLFLPWGNNNFLPKYKENNLSEIMVGTTNNQEQLTEHQRS